MCGVFRGWGLVEESGRALPDAHPNDDKTVVRMGHPKFWWSRLDEVEMTLILVAGTS